jgi:hypothetical protein
MNKTRHAIAVHWIGVNQRGTPEGTINLPDTNNDLFANKGASTGQNDRNSAKMSIMCFKSNPPQMSFA